MFGQFRSLQRYLPFQKNKGSVEIDLEKIMNIGFDFLELCIISKHILVTLDSYNILGLVLLFIILTC